MNNHIEDEIDFVVGDAPRPTEQEEKEFSEWLKAYKLSPEHAAQVAEAQEILESLAQSGALQQWKDPETVRKLNRAAVV